MNRALLVGAELPILVLSPMRNRPSQPAHGFVGRLANIRRVLDHAAARPGRHQSSRGPGIEPARGPGVAAAGQVLVDRSVDLDGPGADLDRARIAEAVLAGGKLDLKERTASVGSVSVRQAKVAISRDSSGRLSLLSLLRQQKPSPTNVKPVKGSAGKPTAPFRYVISSAAGKGIDVSFRDETRSSHPRFDLKGIDVTATAITDVLRTPIPVRFSASYGSGAKLSAKGNITREPFRYNGNIQVKNLPAFVVVDDKGNNFYD